ncbi:Serine/threonine protein kinase [Polaribacter sp. KT25b]|uniref:serine/threonine-protein kinase n=1 Tax=Polaribacter sp. KT25b TaxID=1855336 RepID=UPI00087C1C48|nr:serine/threonine-protein kinase [Polaribacter sp. KT25b]SDR98951.1 Serine/threonine protein kinase [Polaribacter sp. KT25b]
MTQQEFRKRYEFDLKTDTIGGGSFGTVYKAYDTVLDIEVAIKVSEVKIVGDKEFSLLEEFKAIENLKKHKNIANYEEVYRFESFPAIYDYGIMQYYALGNLSHYLKNNEVSLEKRDSITKDILEGIAFLHQHKVVHRDLKPSNILVVDRRGKIIPKITDFGLSKQAEGDGKASRFTNSFAGGTLQYSSPEQLKGLPLKLNTDLWSFGAIAYEILTGKTLFEADNQGTASAEWQNTITQKILHTDVSKELEKLPVKWKKVVTACLEKDVNKRIQNASTLFSILNDDENVQKENFEEKETIVKPKKSYKEKESTSKNNNDATRIKGKEKTVINKEKEPINKEPIENRKSKNLLVYVISIVFILAIALFFWKPWEKNIETKDLQTYTAFKNKAANAYKVDSLDLALKYYKEVDSFMNGLNIKAAKQLLLKEGIIDSINSLNKIIKNQLELAIKKENDAWDVAKKTNTIDTYNRYLNEYPNGVFSETAKSLVLDLRKKQLTPNQIKKQVITAIKQGIEKRESNRTIAQKFLKLQSKLTIYKLLNAVYKVNNTNGIEYDFLELLDNVANSSNNFLEIKDYYKNNMLSRKRLSQIVPFLLNDINSKIVSNTQFDKESFNLLSADVSIVDCIAETELKFNTGRYDNRFIDNQNSQRSIFNFLRMINEAILSSNKSKSAIKKDISVGIKKVNNEIYYLVKSMNMDAQTRELFNSNTLSNGNYKLVKDSFKSSLNSAISSANGFYRFRYLRSGEIKLDDI